MLKIVNQLSSLPTAKAGGGGGIDLDIDLPMNNVRRSAPTGMRNMFSGKGKMLALGAGALGLGAAGAGVVNALSDSDKLKTQVSTSSFSEESISLFSSAVEKFSNLIDSLIKNASGSKQKISRSSSSSGKGSSPGSPGSPGSDLGLTGNAPVADVSKDVEFIQEVQKLSKEVGVAPSQLLSLYQAESGIDPSKATPSGFGGGLFQLMDPSKYGFTDQQWRSLSRADQVRVHRKYLSNVGVKAGGKQGFENVVMANFCSCIFGSESRCTSLYKRNKSI